MDNETEAEISVLCGDADSADYGGGRGVGLDEFACHTLWFTLVLHNWDHQTHSWLELDIWYQICLTRQVYDTLMSQQASEVRQHARAGSGSHHTSLFLLIDV